MTDWVWRPDCSWVTPRIAISGAIYCPEHAEFLERAGVSHVVNCRTVPDPDYVTTTFETLWLPTPDDGEPKPAEWFEAGVRFGLEALSADPRNRLLYHCRAGENRAPSMVYALLRGLGASPQRAEGAIRRARRRVRLAYRADAEEAVVGPRPTCRGYRT